eukprot:g6662.t1
MPSTATRYSIVSSVFEIDESVSPEDSGKHWSHESLPGGIYLLQRCFGGRRLSYTFHKYLVLFLTFIIYATYHASRRPLNVVKPILSPFEVVSSSDGSCSTDESTNSNEKVSVYGTGWEPFTGKQGEERLVALDFAFLFSYAIGVFLSGRLADRSNLRHFLLWGMLGSGASVFCFGLGYFLSVHSFMFYLLLQIVVGLFQSTGWPAVVAIVAQWFGEENLGLIMGIWNAHASIGNSVGSALSAAVLPFGWGHPFLLLGSLIGVFGIVFWFFLIPQPTDAGFGGPVSNDKRPRIEPNPVSLQESVTLSSALSIPGVIPFAFALFFSKFVAYTFLFWLPYYISSICINNRQLTASEAGDFSILFDIGGIIGGVFAGWCFDRSRTGASVSSVFNLVSIPVLLAYNHLGRQSVFLNLCLLAICGFCVNGPYALITTAISAELGMHESVQGNARALSTVAAIIDGMGSLGAALGPTLTGQIVALSSKSSFSHVFLMLAVASCLSVVVLMKVSLTEMKESIARQRRSRSPENEDERLVKKSNLS